MRSCHYKKQKKKFHVMLNANFLLLLRPTVGKLANKLFPFSRFQTCNSVFHLGIGQICSIRIDKHENKATAYVQSCGLVAALSKVQSPFIIKLAL